MREESSASDQCGENVNGTSSAPKETVDNGSVIYWKMFYKKDLTRIYFSENETTYMTCLFTLSCQLLLKPSHLLLMETPFGSHSTNFFRKKPLNSFVVLPKLKTPFSKNHKAYPLPTWLIVATYIYIYISIYKSMWCKCPYLVTTEHIWSFQVSVFNFKTRWMWV